MDNWLDQAVWNSYQVLTGMYDFDGLIDHLELRKEEVEDPEDVSVMPVFFIPPDKEVDNEDIDEMIAYYEDLECYEECAVLLKLKK
jgi:hypothetical protein|tara:strand:- start:2788 stop:3045 length:258 start_codon:yes stop_codon:yes gene_type:complete